MIFPDKTLALTSSLIGVGSLLIGELKRPKTVSELWEKVKVEKFVTSYEKFTLATTLLFSLGLVVYKDGFLVLLKHD